MICFKNSSIISTEISCEKNHLRNKMSKEFQKELANFQILFPGGKKINFSDNEFLASFLQHQFPDWKRQVTSVPVARLPRLFLQHDQMPTTTLRGQLSSLQKGEAGEISVYDFLMKSGEYLECGCLVFPNVDGTRHFRCSVGCVELDVVVLHPKKGAFVFNVKNAGNVKEKSIVADILKHSHFIRLIQTFDGWEDMPVHTVVCSLQKELDPTRFKNIPNYPEKDKIFLIQPHHMEDFESRWTFILHEIDDLSVDYTIGVDVLAARLAALNSMEETVWKKKKNKMEGPVTLVHNQFSANHIQTIQRKREVAEKIVTESIRENLVDREDLGDVERLTSGMTALQTTEEKGKKSFILWTNEQQKIISSIASGLFSNPSDGSRILVCGPKGSGKTMLMIFIARLARRVFTDDKICIMDGRSGISKFLFKRLKEQLKDTDIDVISEENMVKDPLGCMDEVKRIKAGKELIMYDECGTANHFFAEGGYLSWALSCVTKGQHLILFSSVHPEYTTKNVDIKNNFKIYRLTNSLRSTCEIAHFVESFRGLDQANNIDCPAVIAHNLKGTAPTLQIVSLNHEDDLFHLTYIDAVIAEIDRCRHQCQGLKEILVTPFLHRATVQRIAIKVERLGWMWNFDFKNNPNWQSKKSIGFPKIRFDYGRLAEGVEYGAVIVLLDRSLPDFIEPSGIHEALYVTCSRATALLSIVINDCKHVPSLFLQSRCFPVYSFIQCESVDFGHRLERVMELSSWSTSPVLVLGDQKFFTLFGKGEKLDYLDLAGRHEFTLYGYKNKIVFNESYCGNLTKATNVYGEARKAALEKFGHNSFSAIVVLIESKQDMKNHWHHIVSIWAQGEQLTNCPYYVLTACSHYVPGGPTIDSICNQLITTSSCHNPPILKLNDFSDDRIEIESWRNAKDKGNELFKSGDLKRALSKYQQSLHTLENEYQDYIKTLDVDSLIYLQDELSKIHTNISKVHYDIGSTEEADIHRLRMVMSMIHAQKSTALNPFWIKGHHRFAEAMKNLTECKQSVEDAEKRMKNVGQYDSATQYEQRCASVLKLKNINEVSLEHSYWSKSL